MRVGFTGTQRGMTDAQQRTVFGLLDGWEPWWSVDALPINTSQFRHGDCIGADEQAHHAALTVGIPIIIHPPTDPKKRAFCKGAVEVKEPNDYMTRNQHIVNATAALIATPRRFLEEVRSGTWATVRRAHKKLHPVELVLPDGSHMSYEQFLTGGVLQ